MTKIPESIMSFTRDRLAKVVAERERVVTPLDEEIAALRLFLEENMQSRPVTGRRLDFGDEIGYGTPEAVAELAELSITAQIKATAKAMIVNPFAYVTTQQIYDAMVGKGVVFPETGKPPLARITRVVSGTGLYKGHKSKGWTLKGETPAATGVSSATLSMQGKN